MRARAALSAWALGLAALAAGCSGARGSPQGRAAGGPATAPRTRAHRAASRPAGPLRALIVTGRNNHDWRFTSRELAALLEASGRFAVRTTENPARDLAAGPLLAWADVVVLDYNGPRFGAAAEQRLLRAVRAGKGLAVLHAANNAFPDWPEYGRAIGLVWVNGRSGHGRFHRFDLRALAPAHPILSGALRLTGHPDELYHGLVERAPYLLLMDALSTRASGGSGRREPLVLVRHEGAGRVFHTALGHVWPGRPETRASWFDHPFRLLVVRGIEWAASGRATIAELANVLTPGERAAGWRLLFDGRTTKGWRGFRRRTFPARGWVVRGGALVHEARGGGGDLVSEAEFGDFELKLEWRVAPGGNSGIMYRVDERAPATWASGPEMQILDDAGHHDGRRPETSAGALYGLYACRVPAVRPAGQWNRVRIVARGGRIEHWLNGKLVVQADLDSADFRARVARSKFARMPLFAKARRGRIALQDHGDEVAFRGIKIRVLVPEAPR